MEDTHRAKKRRTDQWAPADSAGATKSRAKSLRTTTISDNKIDSYRTDSSAYRNFKPRQNGSDQFSHDSTKPRPRRPEHANSKPRNNGTTDFGLNRHSSNRSRVQYQHFHPNNHTKKSRKSNPSTRIRSLRKQLAHPSAATLPANVLAEKERELRFLIDSAKETPQTQDCTIKSSKRDRQERKTLSQYHMVRFFERKKAERYLKRTRKQVEEATEQQKIADQKMVKASSKLLKKELRRHECDLLYCLYAPLGEKYIALFAGDGQSNKSKVRKANGKGNGSSDDGLPTDNPHLIRPSTQRQDDTFRPPHWYTIQSILKYEGKKIGEDENEGDLVQVPQDNDVWTSITISPGQLEQLEVLRDGKGKPDSSNSNRPNAADTGLPVRSKELLAGKKRKAPSWQEETDEPINPVGADSDDLEDGGMSLDVEGDQGKESESDGDFFEI